MSHLDGYDQDTARGLAIGVIIAIAISVFFFFCVIPAVGCCLWQRRKKRLALRNKEAGEAYARAQANQAASYPMAPYGQNQTQPVEIGGNPLNGYYGQGQKEGGNTYQYGPPQTQGVQQTV